jgi:hypothetical protein
MESNKETRSLKLFGAALIAIGFFISILATLYMCGHEEQMLAPSYSYKMGIVCGISIGLSLSGGLIRLYVASNT